MKKDDDNGKPDNGLGTVTIRDIARELGISHATVSLAMRDHARISDRTIERVKQKAEEMGYNPDPTLSALSHYRKVSKDTMKSTVLAWINPGREAKIHDDLNEFRLYREGAEASVKRMGFELEEFALENMDLDSLLAELRERQIQGIVVAPVTSQSANVDWESFPWHEFSSIRFGRNEIGPPIKYVASAQVSNTILMFKKAEAKGY